MTASQGNETVGRESVSDSQTPETAVDTQYLLLRIIKYAQRILLEGRRRRQREQHGQESEQRGTKSEIDRSAGHEARPTAVVEAVRETPRTDTSGRTGWSSDAVREEDSERYY